MKSVSHYKNLNRQRLSCSLSVVPLHCPFLHVVTGTYYFTYLLMPLSIAKLIFSR